MAFSKRSAVPAAIFQFMGAEKGVVLPVAILHLGEFYRFHVATEA